MKKLICTVLLAMVLLTACGSTQTQIAAANGFGHTTITPQRAQEMMDQSDMDVLILDVRHLDEFQAGHIPGAVLLPGNEINERAGEVIPDLDQIILIYCRSGARSHSAALVLVDLGYTAVYDFGGIISWTGDMVR
ncbi:MAG: rhodanese-like domain-containing protein [Defluviitaleaceae bacterium]|nr:rhodanese-like domain-containing protein [Defluviitaleaceae bacterium]